MTYFSLYIILIVIAYFISLTMKCITNADKKQYQEMKKQIERMDKDNDNA